MFPSDQKQKHVSGQGIQAGAENHFHVRTPVSWNKTLENKQEIKELQSRAHSRKWCSLGRRGHPDLRSKPERRLQRPGGERGEGETAAHNGWEEPPRQTCSHGLHVPSPTRPPAPSLPRRSGQALPWGPLPVADLGGRLHRGQSTPRAVTQPHTPASPGRGGF